MTTPAIFQPRAGLPRTFERLRAQKQLAVGYFGGSISEGAGASDAAQTSWRALTTAWFACQFPGADIREVSAALGGTGSPLGAFRLQNDLLRFAPDLTFIEFAVNDDFDGQAQAARARRRALEGIVRRIRANLPQSEIVFTYTLTESMSRALGSDGLPRSTQLHEEIARHYAIPAVNVGQALLEQIAAGAGDWPHFTTDGVHPNDAGYRVYADAVQEFLAQLQSGASALSASALSASALSASAQSASAQSASALSASALSASAQSASAQSASAQSASALSASALSASAQNAPLPSPLESASWQNGAMIEAADSVAPGWEVVTRAPATMTPEWHPERYATRFLASDRASAALNFQFQGPLIGLFYLIADDAGDLEYALDGGAPARLRVWDKFARDFTRPGYALLATDLAPSAHHLTVRSCPDEAGRRWTRLLAFLVDDIAPDLAPDIGKPG